MERNGEMSVQSMEEMGKTSVQTFPNLFLKILTEGTLTMEAGSLFQYFATLTGNEETPLQVVARTLEYLVGVSS